MGQSLCAKNNRYSQGNLKPKKILKLETTKNTQHFRKSKLKSVQ